MFKEVELAELLYCQINITWSIDLLLPPLFFGFCFSAIVSWTTSTPDCCLNDLLGYVAELSTQTSLKMVYVSVLLELLKTVWAKSPETRQHNVIQDVRELITNLRTQPGLAKNPERLQYQAEQLVWINYSQYKCLLLSQIHKSNFR